MMKAVSQGRLLNAITGVSDHQRRIVVATTMCLVLIVQLLLTTQFLSETGRGQLVVSKASTRSSSTFQNQIDRSRGVDQQQPPRLMNLWQDRLSDGGGFLFFKHIRKAGGSSLRSYLQKVLSFHGMSLWDFRSDVLYYEQEYGAMHWQCPALDAARWQKTVSIISLRHPIERHLSEFFYSGYKPVDKNDAFLEMYLASNYSAEFYALLEQHLPPWIERGMERVQSSGLLYRHFSDNFQVRALSGETDKLPAALYPLSNCTKTDMRLFRGKTKCKMQRPCWYGGKGRYWNTKGYWGGGTPANHDITDVALARAKHALEQFDIVLLTETLSDPEVAELLSDAFSVPLQVASTAKTKLNVRNPFGKSDMLLGMESMIPETLELLERHSMFEKQLYEHAKQIHENLLQRWKKEKSQMVI